MLKKILKGFFILLVSGFIQFGYASNTCDYKVELTDPGYGDGWNGGSLDVLVSGAVVLDDLTLASGYGPEFHSFLVVTGDTISTDYTAGAWSYENYYAIYNHEDQLVVGTGYPNGTPVDLSGIIVSCPGSIPVALDVNFTGTLQVGQTLTGSYTYMDADGDDENGSTYKWYRSDEDDGTGKVAIADANRTTYLLDFADLGKFMSFEVTPKNNYGTGDANESVINPIPVAAPPMPMPTPTPEPKHEVEIDGVKTVVTSPLSTAKVEILADGTIRTTAGKIELGDGYYLEAVAETTPEGKTRTMFVKINENDPDDRTIIGYTYTYGTPFEIGTIVIIEEIDGLLYIIIKSPLNGKKLTV